MLRHLIEWFVDPPAVVLSARRVQIRHCDVVEPDTSRVVSVAVPADQPEYVKRVLRARRVS